RVPHRPLRQRPRSARQGELRAGRVGGELPRRPRRAPEGQAGLFQGSLPQEDLCVVHHGPRREDRLRSPSSRDRRLTIRDPGGGAASVAPGYNRISPKTSGAPSALKGPPGPPDEADDLRSTLGVRVLRTPSSLFRTRTRTEGGAHG